MKKSVLLYGLALAILVFLLEYFEYRYFVRDISTEGFIFIIALMFAGLGLWVGRLLTSQKQASSTFQKNEKALDYLGISDRELEVLELVALGLSNKEIAGKLFVSINTVKPIFPNCMKSWK